MLTRASSQSISRSSVTVSRGKQNVAAWCYGVAIHWWGKYQECCNEQGYYKPADSWRVKRSLSLFRFYSQMGDSLLGILPYRVRRRFRPKAPPNVDTSHFADDFEKALIQRGNQAKRAAGFA